jgi:hypothetical protein
VKARAFALARRPVGNAAHKSSDGKAQAGNTGSTLPLSRSGSNISNPAVTAKAQDRIMSVAEVGLA